MEHALDVPIGWAGGTGLNSIADVRREAQYAARGGFDAFWVSQIFGVDPFVALAAVAADLDGVAEVGTSVVPVYGRHPLALAAQALTAQDALGGRFTLGVGPSHAMVVEGFFGQSYDRPFTYTAQYVEALDRLLRGESVDVEASEVFAKGWLTVAADPVPIMIAAMGTRMLEFAGRFTVGTMLGFPVGPRTIAQHVAPTINASAAAVDRRPPRICASVSVVLTDDPERARESSRQLNTMYADLPAYRAMLDREGVASPGDLLVAGDPDAVRAGLAAYLEAGATELRVGAGGATEEERQATLDALPELLGIASTGQQ